MSKGFMLLALATCLVLLPAMGVSFWRAFRSLSKMDLVFSSLSISIGNGGDPLGGARGCPELGTGVTPCAAPCWSLVPIPVQAS